MIDWQKRRVGRTSLEVTSLGFGTATMGGGLVAVSREESEAMLRAAWETGLRYVDTAPLYGAGAAERRVGDALRDKPRDQWVLSSKVGRLLKPARGRQPSLDGRAAPMPFTVVYDYGYDAIMRSVEDSYQRLGLERIDILLVHDIGAYQHKEAAPAHMTVLRDSGYKALAELKRSGEVGAIGIGVNETEVLIEAMGWGDWDVLLLAGRYTLLEQGPLDDLLPLCQRRGTSIVIGGPLNSGILAGRDTWNYAPAPAEVVERVKRLRAVCERHGVTLAAAALQFPLAHQAVCATIPGPRTVAEFNTNVELIRRPIPAELWAELKHEKLLHADAPVPA